MKTLASLVLVLIGSAPAASADDLFEAVGSSDVATVKKLLDADSTLVARQDAQGYTPLQCAASRDSVEIVKLLLDAKADVNARAKNDDHTPLERAAWGGNKDVVALLLERGADVNAATKEHRYTPLHRAAYRGHVAIMTLLLARAAAVDGGWREKESAPPHTPLQLAVREGHLDATRLLLAKGATVNAKPSGYDLTALEHAVARGDVELVKLLFRNGADPNQESALPRALSLGIPEMLRLFVAKGADFTADAPRLLVHATESGKKDVVELVLAKSGVILTDAENHGMGALFSASRDGRSDIVRLLLEKLVDPNIIGKRSSTPLHVAATTEVAELLLKHRAKIDEPDADGVTPMHAAVLRGNRAVALWLEAEGATHTVETMAALGRDLELKALLEKKPLPKPTKPDRRTALHLAAWFGEPRTARVLLDAGADVNAAGPLGETPLHDAAARGHLPLVELLVEHKANVNASMKPTYVDGPGGSTPLMSALRGGHADVVRFLAKAGGLPAIDGTKNATKLLSRNTPRSLAIVKLLIEQGAPADTRFHATNGTALHIAAQRGDLEMVKWLVARELDVEDRDHHGQSPLLYAASEGHGEVVKFLLGRSAKLDDATLFQAAAGGHVALVEWLLVNGAKRDAVSTGISRYTALGHAAAAGKLEVVRLLHQKGASVKEVGALHNAALRGHREVVAFLLDEGADVEEPLADGFDLYYWTFDGRRRALLSFFAETDPATFRKGLRAGVTIEEVNGGKQFGVMGGRPLHAAVAARQKAVAALLLDRGASPKVLFPDGSTLLHLAAGLGDTEMVELLLKHGTPPDTRNNTGRTAIDVAVERDEEEVVALLRKHGVKR